MWFNTPPPLGVRPPPLRLGGPRLALVPPFREGFPLSSPFPGRFLKGICPKKVEENHRAQVFTQAKLGPQWRL